MFLMIPSAIHDVYDIYIYIQPNFSPTCRSSKDALIPYAFDLSKVDGTCFLRAPDEATQGSFNFHPENWGHDSIIFFRA